MTAKKAEKLFHYFIAGSLIVPAIFLMAKNAIVLSIVFFLAFLVFTYASPKISPKSTFRLARNGKIGVIVLFVIGILIGATIDAEHIAPPTPEEIAQREVQSAKDTYIEAIKDASGYVTDVEMSESDTDIHISIKRASDEASYLDKAGQAIYEITRAIHKDIPTYASNQLVYVLYAPLESGQERAATITYRPSILEAHPLTFEKEISYASFLDMSDRVIIHRGRAGRKHLTDWCDQSGGARQAILFCQKAREQ